MRTLVIHPDDRTTDFLCLIYFDKNYTVITDHYEIRARFLSEIKKHDRIIMMGHGCPWGLLGFTQLFMSPKIIKELRKKECVSIWCHADRYVNEVGIKGFYTGMFISEVSEASYYGIGITQKEITESNLRFSYYMREYLDSPNILNEVRDKYSANDCPVIEYNSERLYYRDKVTKLNTAHIEKYESKQPFQYNLLKS